MSNQASEVTFSAEDHVGGRCRIKFSEEGYTVLEFSPKSVLGGVNDYLHVGEGAPEEITEACRNQIIKYFFNHPDSFPGVGASIQTAYFLGLTTEEMERIGNNGERAYYDTVSGRGGPGFFPNSGGGEQ